MKSLHLIFVSLLITLAIAQQNLRNQPPTSQTLPPQTQQTHPNTETDSVVEYDVVDIQLSKPRLQSGKQNYIKHAVNPSFTFSFCGNNRLDKNEICDDGNLIDGDGCSSYCQMEAQTLSTSLIVFIVIILAIVIIGAIFLYLKNPQSSMSAKTEGGDTGKQIIFQKQ